MKKLFVYFVCLSFLIMNSLLGMVTEAKEKFVPIGEMVSKGEVKFEVRENVWKQVEPSHFPIFERTRIRTDRGMALVTLPNNVQVDVSSNSIFSLDQDHQFVLFQGSIEFRVPSGSEIHFKVGNLSILKSRVLQAAKDSPSAPSISGETIGSIAIHSDGSVTIKSIVGRLTIVNHEGVVLAALSSQESVTMPSTGIGVRPPVKVAQVGEVGVGAGAGTILGVSTTTALVVLGGAAALGAIVWAASEAAEEEEEAPVCP